MPYCTICRGDEDIEVEFDFDPIAWKVINPSIELTDEELDDCAWQVYSTDEWPYYDRWLDR